MITLYTILLILIISFTIKTNYVIKFRKIQIRYQSKIDLLKIELEKKKTSIKSKAYYDLFNISSMIFTNHKPNALTIYFYRKNEKLKHIVLRFIYQLIIRDGEQTPIFNNGIDGVPITAMETLTTVYTSGHNNQHYHLIDDINNISKYDTDLYEELKNNNVKKLVLLNFYATEACKKPIGVVILSYKNSDIDLDIDKCIIDIQKLSKPILNIIE